MVSLLLMTGLSFVSCSDDGDGGSAGWNTGGSSLVGTTWTHVVSSSSSSKPEGISLRFVTTSVVQFVDWEYEHGTDYVEDVTNVTYEYTAPNGRIFSDDMPADTRVDFVVNGNKLTYHLHQGDEDEYTIFTLEN